MFSSVQEVREGLLKAGYIADSIATTTVFLAASLHRPVFSEGPAGSGKTQLAYAVAQAANTTVERLQCYDGIGEDKAIGKFDESLQRLCVELKAKTTDVNWQSLKRELHAEQFFSAGPLLRALQCENPCVLLIDELDKVDHAFEAQAFKRSCACFGLGRYLYRFEGIWVDLDDRKRPKTLPRLPLWATPEGWLKGQRPDTATGRTNGRQIGHVDSPANAPTQAVHKSPDQGRTTALIRQIEALACPLEKGLYRGLLKTVAGVWNPSQIQDPALLERVLTHMRAAERGLRRLDATLDITGPEVFGSVLDSLRVPSLNKVDNLETLKQIVLKMEELASRRSR